MSVECNYCGKEFTEKNSEYDPETDKGIHVSKEHVEDGKIPQPSAGRDPYTSLVNKWDQRENQAEGEQV